MSIAVSFELEITGPALPEVVTDRQAMLAIGNAIRTIIIRRTQNGTDAKGRPFRPYSERGPVYIPIQSLRTRLAPKGGDVTPSGKSMKFANYGAYKRKSRLPGSMPRGGSGSSPTSEVDLILTGQLMRSIETAQADEDSVIVQTGPGTADYADPVNDLREFMGIAPSDYDILESVVAEQVGAALKRKGYR